jgi:two-component system phosphate regulon sensor histidine kinase PhoR
MKSIRSKLFTTFAALLMIIFLLLGVAMTLFVRTLYLETVRSRLVEEAQVAGELIKPDLLRYPQVTDAEELKAFVENIGEQTNARITLVAPDGTVLGDTFYDADLMDNHLNRPEIRAAIGERTESSIRYSNTVDQEMLYTAVSLDHNGQRIGFLRIALSLRQLNEAIRRVQLGLLAGLFIFLLLSLAVILKLSSSLTYPLQQIAKGAEDIARGELTSRIYLHNQDETGKLAQSINQMAESLQDKVQAITSGKEQLETILDTMVEGVLVFDSDGKAVMINPAAEQMLGLQKDHWLGRRDLEMIRSVELHEKIATVGQEHIYLEHELTIMFPDKKVLSITLVPVKAKTPENSGVLAVFHDTTRLRRLEEMRSDFAANVSHELRTPLTAIQGFAETLLDGAYSEPESALRFSRIIHQEAQRLNDLIEDVLKLSKIEGGKTVIRQEPVDLRKLVSEVIERMGERLMEHTVQKQIPEGLPHVSGDHGLLSQALFNLLDNAVKYTQSQGIITICAVINDRSIVLSVADNGIGIPDDAKERIFERFYRVDRTRSRRFGGTGLGLAIVKHIAEAHKGELQLDSQEGKGTRMSLTLPIYTDGNS